MILCDNQIEAAMRANDIIVTPFDPKDLRINSLDVHLGSTLLVSARLDLDAAVDEQWDPITIPSRGIVLSPGTLYLGVTCEYTESHRHVPYLDGKSSVGRLGCFIHATAGRGDVGFCGHWTMEISVVQPLRIYAGMPIGQLTWHECGIPSAGYNDKPGSNFAPGSHATERPVPSALWKKLQAPVTVPSDEVRTMRQVRADHAPPGLDHDARQSLHPVRGRALKRLRLPAPGETWRSPNGHECVIGNVLGNCVWLEGVGYFNRKMVALTWTPMTPEATEAMTDEEVRP